MLEKDVEKKIVREVKRRGGLALKFSSPSRRGVADRLILLPGCSGFLEIKKPGKKPTKLQMRFLDQVQLLGFPATWTDSLAGAKEFLDDLEAGAFPKVSRKPERSRDRILGTDVLLKRAKLAPVANSGSSEAIQMATLLGLPLPDATRKPTGPKSSRGKARL